MPARRLSAPRVCGGRDVRVRSGREGPHLRQRPACKASISDQSVVACAPAHRLVSGEPPSLSSISSSACSTRAPSAHYSVDLAFGSGGHQRFPVIVRGNQHCRHAGDVEGWSRHQGQLACRKGRQPTRAPNLKQMCTKRGIAALVTPDKGSSRRIRAPSIRAPARCLSRLACGGSRHASPPDKTEFSFLNCNLIVQLRRPSHLWCRAKPEMQRG
jgi:hypothetical protein